MISRARFLVTSLLLGLILVPGILMGQDRSPIQEQLRRIFEAKEYDTKTFGPARWLDDGASYTTVEPSGSHAGKKDIVRYDTASGQRQVLISASRLIPEGHTQPLTIEDYDWSENRERLLIFTNTKKVWRRNTRGDYWVLDLDSGKLQQLGGSAEPSTLMFAKFSPEGSRVGYVRENNLYVEILETGKITALTKDGSKTTINGTSDWVYEEEFGVRDGFRWSPDGKKIAFWNFDSTGVGTFYLINNTDSIYPELTPIPYPKVGTTNSAVRVGVVAANGGAIQWMNVPGDRRNTYIARMDWAGDSSALVLQHLNRLQNTNNVLLANAETGVVSSLYRDQSDTWVEVMDRHQWLTEGRELLWLSEKDGWQKAYALSKDGSDARLITRFDADVTDLFGAGSKWLYFQASPDNASQRYLFRALIDGSSAPERLTPTDQPGTHAYDISPDRKWAFHTYSSFEKPPIVELVSLPEHARMRVLVDNAEVAKKTAPLLVPPAEFFEVEIEGDVVLDAWMIKPRSFDPGKKYPILIFVYGEPAGQTVLDRWGGSRMLFHRALAREGFVVASIDNRGTPAPKGVAWRKVIYGTVGYLSAKEQAAAVQALARKYPFIDGERVAVWGWSGGGSNTLNCIFRHPDVFKVGVSVAPVPDQRLYDTIYQERYMGLPDDNEEGYHVGSPINFAEGLEGELLIIHGTGDDNVHYQGTEKLINRLVALGKRFDVMVYPNRSHSISEGGGTSLHIYSLIARYILEARWE